MSVTVVNEDWFQSQPEDVRKAIVEAGRLAEAEVLDFGRANVERANTAWTDNGGVIRALSDEERARMSGDFATLAEELVSAEPAMREEYERMLALVAAAQAN